MTDRSALSRGQVPHDSRPGAGEGGAGHHDADVADDEHLIAQARGGSGDAFEELWRRHAAAGRRVAARFTQVSDPDDLVQEAYLRIYSAMRNGSGPDLAFRPYLYQTIRNIAITWAGRPVEQSIAALDDISDGSDMSSAILESSVTATAFRSLPARWQSVLWYSEVEGLEPAEIAPLLGITPGAVSALAYRAREGLRRAWLQVHVNSDAAPRACTWAAKRMGDFNRGALRGATRTRFVAHVSRCLRCLAIVDEVDEVARTLGPVMVPIVVGVPWDTFAGAVTESGTGADADTDAEIGSARRTGRAWTGPVAVVVVLATLAMTVGGVSSLEAGAGARTRESMTAVRTQPLAVVEVHVMMARLQALALFVEGT